MHSLPIALSLLLLGGTLLGAQAMPLVQRTPVDSVVVVRPSSTAIHIHEGFSIGPHVTVIIDRTVAWPVRGDSVDASSATYEQTVAGLSPDDIVSIDVLKGARAVARGACAGTDLLIISTKSGNWRPPAGTTSAAMKMDCDRVAP